jgi:signal transduction histidine kinase
MEHSNIKEARYFGLSLRDLLFTGLIIIYLFVCFAFIFRIDDGKVFELIKTTQRSLLYYSQAATLSALLIASFYAFQLSKRHSFLYLGFVWVSHLIYKLFAYSIERLDLGVEDKIFLIGIIALVADLPLFLCSFPDKYRKLWIALFPVFTFLLMLYVINSGYDYSIRHKIVYVFSPLQSLLILIWLSYSTIFNGIFSSSKKLSIFFAFTFVGLAISQIPYIYMGYYDIELDKPVLLPWKLFSLSIFTYSLVIIFYLVKNELRLISKKTDSLEGQLKVKGEFEDLGYLAASVEHEIRNPLQAIKDEVANLKVKFQNESEIIDKFHPLELEVDRMSLAANIIKILRLEKEEFANKLKETMVIDRIKSSVKYVKKEFPLWSERVSIKENEITKDLHIKAFPPYLEQVFINLFKNSYESFQRKGKRGEVFIDLYLVDKNTVGVLFSDTGDGFIPEDIPNLIKPNYTKKDKSKSESNRGLGLFVCDKVVKLHNGIILFSNNESGGAEVKLEFPRYFTKKMQKMDLEDN